MLDKIVAAKRTELEETRRTVPLRQLERQAAAMPEVRSLAATLEVPGTRVIAEIKRASPSRGDINPGLEAASIARAYEEGGAAALSVLTESRWFKGSPSDLREARAATSLPVLRKDFVIDPYQVIESRAMGADALLLIARILDNKTLAYLHQLSLETGIEPLVEVFDERDAKQAVEIGARIVGINNRNLANFETNPTHALNLMPHLTSQAILVALSGVFNKEDVEILGAGGIRRVLVGEALASAADPAALLREWCEERGEVGYYARGTGRNGRVKGGGGEEHGRVAHGT